MTEPCPCACHVGGAYRPACDQPGGCEYLHDEPACILGHPEPTPTFVGYLCRRHYHHIGDVLTQITELAALQPYLDPSGSMGQLGGSIIHSPAPGNLYTMALTDRRASNDGEDIPHVGEGLFGWCRMVEEEQGDLLSEGTILVMAIYLHKHRHWIARQPWCDGYARDLDYLHRALAKGSGASAWPEPVGRCPNCDRALYNTVGVDEITCNKCKTTWRGVDLARLRLILEQEASGQ